MLGPNSGLGEAIARAARLYGDGLCFVDAAGAYRTFAEVNDRVNHVASSLAARGVAKGTRIAVVSVDSFEYVELLLACLKLGAVFVPLDHRLAIPELGFLLRNVDADFLFVSGRHVDTGRSLVATLETPPQLLSLDGSLADDLSDLIEQGDAGDVHAQLDEEDILVIMFVCGGSGKPCGVMQSHRLLKGIAFQHREYLPRPGETRYAAWPLFHAAGLLTALTNLTIGCTSLITPQFDPRVISQYIESGSLTGCFLQPEMISTILDLASPDGASQLRTILYAGSGMDPDLLRRALLQWPGCDFWRLYGVESGSQSQVHACLGPNDHRRAMADELHLLGTVGQPLAGLDMQVVDDDGREVPPGAVGHVAVRADAVMSGYLNDPEATRKTLRGGWYFSGDVGRLDERGYLWLVGGSVHPDDTRTSRPCAVTDGGRTMSAERPPARTDIPS